MSARTARALIRAFDSAEVDPAAPPQHRVRFAPEDWVELEMRTLTPAKRRDVATYVRQLVLGTAHGLTSESAPGSVKWRNFVVACAIQQRLQDLRDPRWIQRGDGAWELQGEKRRFPRGIQITGAGR